MIRFQLIFIEEHSRFGCTLFLLSLKMNYDENGTLLKKVSVTHSLILLFSGKAYQKNRINWLNNNRVSYLNIGKRDRNKQTDISTAIVISSVFIKIHCASFGVDIGILTIYIALKGILILFYKPILISKYFFNCTHPVFYVCYRVFSKRNITSFPKIRKKLSQQKRFFLFMHFKKLFSSFLLMRY